MRSIRAPHAGHRSPSYTVPHLLQGGSILACFGINSIKRDRRVAHPFVFFLLTRPYNWIIPLQYLNAD